MINSTKNVASLATCDGQIAHVHKGMGLVSQVFNEENLSHLQGHIAVGHTRYSTTGSSQLRNVQPYIMETLHGPLALAHNGNLINSPQLRRELLERGVGLHSSSDSELIIHLLTGAGGSDWLKRMGYAIASESCAFATIGAQMIREIAPGEIVRVNKDGYEIVQGAPPQKLSFCTFEQIYFARPDSILSDKLVHQVRQDLGRQLARELPVEADIVVPIPDSGTPHAIGYAHESGIPYCEGLIKSRYIGRTFIQPTDQLRKASVAMKFNPLPETHQAHWYSYCVMLEPARCMCESPVRPSNSPALWASIWQAKMN